MEDKGFVTKEMSCAEMGCGTFEWTAGEQQFYADKGFGAPKRCKFHRETARRQREANNEPKTTLHNHSDRDMMRE